MATYTMTSILTLVALMTLTSVQGQVFTKGKICPIPAVQKAFDVTRYMGKWFTYEELPFRQSESRCTTANYTLRADGTVRVVNVAVAGFDVNGTKVFRHVVADGVASIPDDAEPAKLKVDFPNGKHPGRLGDYWVLDTDYDTYTVVYSCRMTMEGGRITEMGKTESCWVLTRSPGVKPTNLPALHTLLTHTDIDVSNMKLVSHDLCPPLDLLHKPLVVG